jgi:hypothetical protein
MKYFIYNCFFICIILLLLIYFNTSPNTEEFTPYIRQIYRPYVRHARIFGEGFYVEQKMNITNLFRKFGIM